MNTESSGIEAILNAINNAPRSGSNAPLVVALDGHSGVGKSTIARRISDSLNAVVVECDGFYLGETTEKWTKMSVKEKVDNCIDWRRLRSEVLEPLISGKVAEWRVFNQEKQEGLSDNIIKALPNNIIILDGIYSARPELSDLVDLSVLIDVSDDSARRNRLITREGKDRISAWQEIWDEAEDYYFTDIMPKAKFDIILQS